MAGSGLSRVTALLVSAPGVPEGDRRCGIEFDVCLNPLGQLDRTACRSEDPWKVRRFWRDRPDWYGSLVPLELGFAVRAASDPDEPLRELEGRTFRPGELLILRRPNDDELVFRIVSVQPPVQTGGVG
jgi:hypothetical protein